MVPVAAQWARRTHRGPAHARGQQLVTSCIHRAADHHSSNTEDRWGGLRSRISQDARSLVCDFDCGRTLLERSSIAARAPIEKFCGTLFTCSIASRQRQDAPVSVTTTVLRLLTRIDVSPPLRQVAPRGLGWSSSARKFKNWPIIFQRRPSRSRIGRARRWSPRQSRAPRAARSSSRASAGCRRAWRDRRLGP